MTSVYTSALEDIPEDLLIEALKQVKKHYKWWHRWPPPAEIREKIDGDMGERKACLFKLKNCVERMKDHEPR